MLNDAFTLLILTTVLDTHLTNLNKIVSPKCCKISIVLSHRKILGNFLRSNKSSYLQIYLATIEEVFLMNTSKEYMRNRINEIKSTFGFLNFIFLLSHATLVKKQKLQSFGL